MTTQDERIRALKMAEDFLKELAGAKGDGKALRLGRIPGAVRLMALSLLRHYPAPTEVDRLFQKP